MSKSPAAQVLIDFRPRHAFVASTRTVVPGRDGAEAEGTLHP